MLNPDALKNHWKEDLGTGTGTKIFPSDAIVELFAYPWFRCTLHCVLFLSRSLTPPPDDAIAGVCAGKTRQQLIDDEDKDLKELQKQGLLQQFGPVWTEDCLEKLGTYGPTREHLGDVNYVNTIQRLIVSIALLEQGCRASSSSPAEHVYVC